MLDKATSREVRSKIRAILMATWDPIAVSDVLEAADEYDGYIGGVYETLEQGAEEERIRAYLREVEIEQMGMVDGSGEPLLPETNRNTTATSLKSLGRYFR